MNKARILVLANLLLISNLSFAANPVPGFYFGVLGGVTYLPSVDFLYPFNNNLLIPPGTIGNMSYRTGAIGGGQLGYRLNGWRAEVEIDYTNLGFSRLEVNNVTLKHKNIPNELFLSGSTSLTSGFINAYYDFFTQDIEVNFMPYVGLGIGSTRINNSPRLKFQGVLVQEPENTSASSMALQGILGFSYYLDDFTTFGVDYRYMTTGKVNLFNDNHLSVHSLNATLNFILSRS